MSEKMSSHCESHSEGWAFGKSVSFGFGRSKSSGEIDPNEYRQALREHIASMQQKLNELDREAGLNDGSGI